MIDLVAVLLIRRKLVKTDYHKYRLAATTFKGTILDKSMEFRVKGVALIFNNSRRIVLPFMRSYYKTTVVSAVEPEPPFSRRLRSWSRFFGQTELEAQATFFKAAPAAPAGSFMKTKRKALFLS